MSAVLLDGTAVAGQYIEKLKQRVSLLKQSGVEPMLAVLAAGHYAPSRVYLNGKRKDCRRCGIRSEEISLPEDTTETEILSEIRELNRREEVHGILVQLPLPPKINRQRILDAITPLKDVDALSTVSFGRLMKGTPLYTPCTPAGIIALLDAYAIETEGKRCVIVSRSELVGKPLTQLLLDRGATVTVCHSKTKDLKAETRRADIVVTAAGRPGLITPEMIGEQTVVIDVSINRFPDGTLTGDCTPEVREKAAYLTPVPGGVGPMTRVMLLENTVKAACLSASFCAE